MADGICLYDDGCKRVVAFGMCEKHYRRWRSNGDPLIVRTIHGDDETRFWFRVYKDGPLPGSDTLAAGRGPCWLFGKDKPLHTYGTFKAWGSKSVRAHRFSYVLANGPVDGALHIDHLCRVPRCVNPDHLEAVPPRINALRGIGAAAQAAKRTHCPKGHEYTPENTYRPPGEEHHRQCRKCIRARNKTGAHFEGPAPILPCPECGTLFKARKNNSKAGRQLTCSLKCGQAYRRRQEAA